MYFVQIFVADGEKEMRRLRAENVMVLRTDRKSLYIYSNSQWINVLVSSAQDNCYSDEQMQLLM